MKARRPARPLAAKTIFIEIKPERKRGPIILGPEALLALQVGMIGLARASPNTVAERLPLRGKKPGFDR
jgi:hypothetical protein